MSLFEVFDRYVVDARYVWGDNPAIIIGGPGFKPLLISSQLYMFDPEISVTPMGGFPSWYVKFSWGETQLSKQSYGSLQQFLSDQMNPFDGNVFEKVLAVQSFLNIFVEAIAFLCEVKTKNKSPLDLNTFRAQSKEFFAPLGVDVIEFPKGFEDHFPAF